MHPKKTQNLVCQHEAGCDEWVEWVGYDFKLGHRTRTSRGGSIIRPFVLQQIT